MVPQSGALGLTGPSAVDAALLAAHELNTDGGVRGAYVDLVLVDGGPSPGGRRGRDRPAVRGRRGGRGGRLPHQRHPPGRRGEVAGRTPNFFTPPHEGGGRRPGVVCTGVDPTRQLSGPIAWLAEHHGVRRWALIGNDYIWPQAVHRHARRLVAAAGGGTVLDRRVPLGGVPPASTGCWTTCGGARGRRGAAEPGGARPRQLQRGAAPRGPRPRAGAASGALEENGLLAADGDRTGTLYAAMSSFEVPGRRPPPGAGRAPPAPFGPFAPALDTYAEGVYDWVGGRRAGGRGAAAGASARRGGAQALGAAPGRRCTWPAPDGLGSDAVAGYFHLEINRPYALPGRGRPAPRIEGDMSENPSPPTPGRTSPATATSRSCTAR